MEAAVFFDVWGIPQHYTQLQLAWVYGVREWEGGGREGEGGRGEGEGRREGGERGREGGKEGGRSGGRKGGGADTWKEHKCKQKETTVHAPSQALSC